MNARRCAGLGIVALGLGLALLPSAATGNDEKPSGAAKVAPRIDEAGEKTLSGMSIVGNDEAPKSLVIVPWKSSALAAELDVSRGLDAGRDPVDPEVFRRALTYYEIRVGQGARAER